MTQSRERERETAININLHADLRTDTCFRTEKGIVKKYTVYK